MIALLISDVVLNIHYGFSQLSPFVLSHYLGFALVLLLSPYIGNVAAALAVGLAMFVAAVAAFLYGRARFLSARIVPPRLARLLSQDSPVKRKAEP